MSGLNLEYLRELQTEEADAFDAIRQRQGAIQTWVHGSHVQITVRLRRRWARAVAKLPTDADLLHACAVCDFWLKFAVIAGVIYLAVEVVVAFLPGGSIERVLGGVK
jgi:hypothetical protein